MKTKLVLIMVLLSSFISLDATAQEKVKIYLFLQSQCPCIYNHKETFGSILKNYGSKASFIAVFTESKESNTAMRNLIHDLGWNLPYIKDNHHQLVQRLQPAVSTDCVLVDAHGKVLYKGAIDDGPMNMGTVKHFYLKDALEAYLHHLPIKISSAKGQGCLLRS